ncbi:MAG: tyrosine-protein phosphatase [Solirubrobacterales bacterium]
MKAGASLPWDGCVNTRHLRDVQVAGGPLSPAALVRSDSVSSLSPTGWQALVGHGGGRCRAGRRVGPCLGRDRTGLVVAFLLLLAGATDDAVSADYAISGPRLEASFAELIASEADPERRRVHEWHRAQPGDLIQSALADPRQTYGGAESYLVAGGAPPDIRERVVARLSSAGPPDHSGEAQ